MATRQVLWPQLASAANQSPTWAAGGSSIFGGWTLRFGLGTYWEHPPLYLPAGNYTAKMLCINQNNAGIVTLSLSGEDVATFDLYNGASLANQMEVDTFTVDVAGFYTPRFTITGQTGTGYNTWINQVEIISASPYYATTDALLPGVVDVPPYLYSSYSGSPSTLISTASAWGGLVQQDGGHKDYPVWLPAGSYTIVSYGTTASFYGIQDFSLDGSDIASIDWYSASILTNQRLESGAFSVPATGLYTLRERCDRKNVAASATYRRSISWMQFVRTSAAGLSATRGRDTIELYPWMADDATQQDWTSISSAIFYGHAFAGTAIDNFREWSVALGAGSWEAEFLHTKGGSYGIAHLLLDGSDLGTADFYAATLTYNQRSVIPFTVGTSGLHTLRVQASSKNPSSAAYYLSFQILRLTRTGD